MSELQRPTKKQSEVLEFIDTYIKEKGFGPNLREIAKAGGNASVSTAASKVDALIGLGYLKKQEKSARSLQVLDPTAETTNPEAVGTHLDWLRQEIAKREANAELSKEAQILKAALVLLDQSEEK